MNAPMSYEEGHRPREGRAPDDGYMMPWQAYVSAEFASEENTTIFNDSWQYVGPSEKVRNPGDHIIAQLGLTPVVVTRDREGQLNALVNVCRHRLHPVALTDGTKPILQCSYHGWTYGLNGRLQSAPRCKDELELDRVEHSLPKVAVTEIGPWVFANANPAAGELDSYFDDCRATLDDMIADSPRYVFQERLTYKIASNWKLFIENALECYHCDLIHGESFSTMFDVSFEGYENHIHEHVITQHGPVKYLPPTVSRDEAKGFRFVFLPPNSLIAMDDFFMLVHQIIPDGPESCTMFVDIHADPAVSAEAREEWMTLYGRTLEEDQLAVERQQLGARAGKVDQGRLLSESEAALRWFESWVLGRVGEWKENAGA